MTTQLPDNFKAGLDLFHTAKPAGDPDLTTTLRDSLSKAGVSEDGLKRNYDQHPHVKNSRSKVSVVQRVSLNLYLDTTLKASPKNTIPLRGALLPQGPIENWTDNIDRKVAPFIAEQGLLEK